MGASSPFENMMRMYNRTNGNYNKKATAVNRQTSPVLTILLYSVEARFPDSRYYESPAGVLSSDRATFTVCALLQQPFYQICVQK